MALCSLRLVIFWKRNEPPHDKTNKLICAPSEDSDQTAQSGQRIRCPHKETFGPQVAHRAHSEDSDQTGVDARSGLSLRWARISFIWFRRAVTQMSSCLFACVVLYLMPSMVFLSRLMSRKGCGVRLFRFLTITFYVP